MAKHKDTSKSSWNLNISKEPFLIEPSSSLSSLKKWFNYNASTTNGQRLSANKETTLEAYLSIDLILSYAINLQCMCLRNCCYVRTLSSAATFGRGCLELIGRPPYQSLRAWGLACSDDRLIRGSSWSRFSVRPPALFYLCELQLLFDFGSELDHISCFQRHRKPFSAAMFPFCQLTRNFYWSDDKWI